MSKQVSRRDGGDFLSCSGKNHHEGQADRLAGAGRKKEKKEGKSEPIGEATTA